jgi:hypothetical protein
MDLDQSLHDEPTHHEFCEAAVEVEFVHHILLVPELNARHLIEQGGAGTREEMVVRR